MNHIYFLVTCSIYVAVAYGLPLTIVNTFDGEEGSDDDDFTTHTLERLSSAATCLVAGIEYTHGQQIYRKDPCEFCLCLDGEMFCWWQDCPPTLEGPCRERSPFSPCSNGIRNNAETTQMKTSTVVSTLKPTQTQDEITTFMSSSENFASTDVPTDLASIVETTTKRTLPKTCIVMGREYKVGELLPHDTGNCVECICGTGGQVTCSPNQCAPLGDDINDYRPPGPRPPLSDVF